MWAAAAVGSVIPDRCGAAPCAAPAGISAGASNNRHYPRVRYLYTADLLNLELVPDDEDYEWSACILVDAESAERAHAWGDHLTKSWCDRSGIDRYVTSSIVPAHEAEGSLERVPVVADGDEASDEYIGW